MRQRMWTFLRHLQPLIRSAPRSYQIRWNNAK